MRACYRSATTYLTFKNVLNRNSQVFYTFILMFQLLDISSHHSEIFAGLPSSLLALRDDVTSGVAENWFTPSELASLNVSIDEDLRLVGELYMIQQIVNSVSISLSPMLISKV
jgi:hypothetical protein